MRRKGKFYSKNEKEVMKGLGLTPAPASGAGWIVKEDGENELSMVQLKSTDSTRYTLDMLDMKKLEYHAQVSNKIPIFLVQFLQEDRMYAIVPVDSILDLSKALETGHVQERISIKPEKLVSSRALIRSSKTSRDKFFEEKEKQYGKR
ncbi:hypothetical protein [Segatella hominis]|jgi:hypothetical protein|uniref:hypothetical protein n=1 Tax=Segatella hominis TaxID=2518605 RepID=UPI00220C1095|nr:MAG: holliday junction resolvase [Bacteriophage sp.]